MDCLADEVRKIDDSEQANSEERMESFQTAKNRLNEIVDLVSDESISLEEALSLYEEAVNVGLLASELLEYDVEPKNQEQIYSELE